jgi:hypothetical protein
VDHDLVIEKTGDSACTVERSVRLKLGILSFGHLLAARHPWVDMNREDDKDLKLVRSSERGLGWVPWGDKG